MERRIFTMYLDGRTTVLNVPRNSDVIEVRYNPSRDPNPLITFIGDITQRYERVTVRTFSEGASLPEMPSYYVGCYEGSGGDTRFVFMSKG